MKNTIAIVALTVALSSAALAQTGDAERSPQTPGSLTSLVDKLFIQWNRADSAGCALGVMKDGKIIYEHGYGMADLEHNIPISPHSVFDIGSVSKQFMAVM